MREFQKNFQSNIYQKKKLEYDETNLNVKNFKDILMWLKNKKCIESEEFTRKNKKVYENISTLSELLN